MAEGQGRLEWRKTIYPWLAFTYLTLIFGLPTLAVSMFCDVLARYRGVGLLFSPLCWTLVFVLTAGLLSWPHQKWVVAGHFPRDLNLPQYFHRRLYGLCWTAVYYNKPIYMLLLSLPMLKTLMFRLFGYRGSMNFTIYPDTWVRDLPLLTFEDGVYLANRSTLGSNIVLKDGTIFVGKITLRERATLGHLGVLGPGTEIGASSEVGVRATVGVNAVVGAHSTISGAAAVAHGVRVGNRVCVAATASVGHYSRLADGTSVHFGEVVPPRTRRRAPEPKASDGEAVRAIGDEACEPSVPLSQTA